MKKVLIFNGYYYPSKNCGGPITSIENIVNTCCDEYEFYIICYNHDFNDMKVFNVEMNTWECVGHANVMYVEQNFLDFSTKNMRKMLEELRPDLIWFSGVLTPNNKIVATKISRKMKIPVLFSPRGELSADRVRIKAYKKIPYLRLLSLLGVYRNCYFHGTSDDEISGIKKYFRPDAKHLFRAANISIAQQEEFVHIKKEKGELKLFFFSRIHEVKNLLFGIKCMCKCKNRVSLDVYGPIESEEYWKKCMAAVEKAPSNISVSYGGILDYTNKSATIQAHHAFLFPTINENYGHVIAESIANSRPVILSKATTPWDDLHEKAGYVVDLSDPEGFTRAIDRLAEMNQAEFEKLILSTKEYFRFKTSEDDAIVKHKHMLDSITKGR